MMWWTLIKVSDFFISSISADDDSAYYSSEAIQAQIQCNSRGISHKNEINKN